MSDLDFELRLQRVLQADADRAVRPIDAVQLATDAAATPVARRPLDWRPTGWPLIRLVLIASALVLAAVATLWLVAGGLPTRPSLVEVAPSASPGGPALSAQAAGRWIADAPADLAIAGTTVADPFVLGVDSGNQAYIQPPEGEREKLLSDVEFVAPDVVRLITRPSPPEVVVAGGRSLGACSQGDEGTYRASPSGDGLLMTLEPLADACPGRVAVLARTWVRYLGGPSAGGIGVVDAIDPLFGVTLPPGSYEANRFPGGVVLHQAAPEFEFLAWRDPQGFNDPCDPIGKGRRPVTNSADFVQYFRELPGFTVDGVTQLEIDGRPAINLKLHANDDASCPAGWLVEWQPREMPVDGGSWLLRPGDSDSLFLVDLDGTTLMFEVLAGPQDLDGTIVPTIRLFEDGLPTSP
jgi:hypothetical protein